MFDFEITLLTVRAAGGTHFCEPIGHVQVDGDYVESWQPQAMSAKALERRATIAGKVTEALGGYGIFGVELFVKGDDVWFTEVSPRPHDTGLVTLVIPVPERIRAARARHPRPAGRHLAARAGRERGDLWRHGSRGHRLRGRRRSARDPRNRTPPVRQTRSFNKRRMGVALARGADTATARANAKRAAALVKPVAG